jgi:hypothetical protein
MLTQPAHTFETYVFCGTDVPPVAKQKHAVVTRLSGKVNSDFKRQTSNTRLFFICVHRRLSAAEKSV